MRYLRDIHNPSLGLKNTYHVGVKYSIGKIVNKIAISMYGARYVLEIWDHFIKYVIV